MNSRKKAFFIITISITSVIGIELILMLLLKSNLILNSLGPLTPFSETLSSIIWRERSRQNDCISDFLRSDPTTGWRVKSNLKQEGWRTNSKGWRDTGPASIQKIEGKRVLFLGDSYTFGLEVKNQEVFSSVLQKLQPQTEIFNLGVPGYAHDQMYLLLKSEIQNIKPNLIVLTYLEMDSDRNMMSSFFMPKPFFKGDKSLKLQRVSPDKLNWRTPCELSSYINLRSLEVLQILYEVLGTYYSELQGKRLSKTH